MKTRWLTQLPLDNRFTSMLNHVREVGTSRGQVAVAATISAVDAGVKLDAAVYLFGRLGIEQPNKICGIVWDVDPLLRPLEAYVITDDSVETDDRTTVTKAREQPQHDDDHHQHQDDRSHLVRHVESCSERLNRPKYDAEQDDDDQ